jgi:hypothetical protein
MNDTVEILTKVYGYVSRIKVCLAFKDIAGIWKVVNELSDYLVSIDVCPTQDAPDFGESPAKPELPAKNPKRVI